MSLQQAIDILHDIRKQFTHVAPFLTATDRKFRDGNTVYILGVYQGTIRTFKRSWVLSSAWEWTEFLTLFSIFTNR